MVLFTRVSAALARGEELHDLHLAVFFFFYYFFGNASPIYNVPMVLSEAIII